MIKTSSLYAVNGVYFPTQSEEYETESHFCYQASK